MSWLQFVASMIASLAWPVAIVLIIVLLRKQFLALLRRIVEVTLPGGYKIVFDTALEEGRASVEKSEAKPSQLSTARIQDFDLLSQMLSAYSEVEVLTTELAMSHGLTGTHWSVWSSLERKGVLSTNAVNALENLRKARNALVHIPQWQVTPLEAIEFVAQAQTLRGLLQSLIEKAPHKRG